MAAKSNQLILEFAAQVDSSIKSSFNQLSSTLGKLTAQLALVSDGIRTMNASNRDTAESARRMRVAVNEVTSSVVKQTTAISKGKAVSQQYLQTQQQIEKQYDLNSAAAGTALRALEKTERQYRRNAAAVDAQKTALTQLLARQRQLAADYRDSPTAEYMMGAYASLQKNAAAIRTARNTLMTSVEGLNSSFNYAKTYADNLARIEQSIRGVSLATKMFGQEQQWVGSLAQQITARTRDSATEQRRQFTLLRQYIREVGTEYQALGGRIRAAESAMVNASDKERAAIMRVVEALRAKQQSLVVGAATGGLAAFDSWANGINRVEKQYRSLRLTFAAVQEAAYGVMDAAKKGLIAAANAQRQLKQIASVNTAVAAVQGKYGLSDTQMSSIVRSTGVINRLNEGRITSMREVNRLLDEEARKLQTTVPLHKRIADEIGNTVKVLAQYAVSGAVVYGIASGFRSAVKSIIDYDQAMKDLQAITGATDVELAALGDEIKRVTLETRYGMIEVAEGAKVIGQAGYDASQTVEVLGATMELAQGTMEKVSSSADLLTTVLMSFRKNASDAAAVADIMAAAINRSKLDIEKLRTVFNYVGPVAMDAGISLQEVTAALMVLANNGMKASTIGTSLRNVFSQLASPSAKLKAAFKDDAEALERLSSTATPLVERFEILNQKLGTNTDLYSLFGLRAAGAVSIMRTMYKDIQELQDSLYVMGTASLMANKQMEGLGNRLKNLGAAAEVFVVSTTTTVAKGFSELVLWTQKAITFLTEFADGVVGNATTTVGALTVAVLALVTAVKVLGVWLGAIGGGTVLGAIATGMTSVGVAAYSMAAGMGTATVASRVFSVALSGVGAALGWLAVHPVIAAFIALAGVVATAATAMYAFGDSVKNVDVQVNKTLRDMSHKMDILRRGIVANEKIVDDTIRRQNLYKVAIEVPDIAQELLNNMSDPAAATAIMKRRLEELTNKTVETVREQMVTLQERINNLRDQREKSATAPTMRAFGRFTRTATPEERDAEQMRYNNQLAQSEKELRNQHDRLVVIAIQRTEAEAAAIGDAANKTKIFKTELDGLTVGMGAYIQSLNVSAVEKFAAENNKILDSKNIQTLNDYIQQNAGVESIEKQAEAYGKLSDIILPRLQKAAQEYYVADQIAQKNFANDSEALNQQLLANKTAYYEKLRRVAETTLKDEIEFTKVEAEAKKQQVAEALEAGTISAQEAAKRRAQIDREAAESSISLIQQMMAYLLLLNKTEIEKKKLNIELILSGNINADTMRILQGIMSGEQFAMFSGLVGNLRNELKARSNAITAGNRPGGRDRTGRDRIAALKAQLAAEQALNEKAYQLGEMSYKDYTDARIASEQRLLAEREKVAMSMSGAERERALQELAKDRAEFELKMIKEQQQAREEAAERQIDLEDSVHNYKLELLRKEGMTEEEYAVRQEAIALTTVREELALLQEKLTWQMNEIDREQLLIDLNEKKIDVLKQERALREAIYEQGAKNREERYRSGLMSAEEYIKNIKEGMDLGKIDPLEGLERIQLAQGPISSIVAGLRAAKFEAKTFNEEMMEFANTLGDKVNNLVDDFVDSWYEGTKTTKELLLDFINDIQREFQKSFMRGLVNTVLYGAPGATGGPGGAGGGVLGFLTGGYGGLEEALGGRNNGRQANAGFGVTPPTPNVSQQGTTNNVPKDVSASETMANVTSEAMNKVVDSTQAATTATQEASIFSQLNAKQMFSAVSMSAIGIMGIASGTKEGLITGIMMLTTSALQIFSAMASAVAASSGAKGVAGLAAGFAGFAKGGMLSGGTISSFSNSIVTRPTPFLFDQKFAKGGVGLMGEVPGKAEAIMPLTKMGNGEYGVNAAVSSGQQTIIVNIMDSEGNTKESYSTTNTQGGNNFVASIKRDVARDMTTYGTPIHKALNKNGMRLPVMKKGG